MTAGNETKRHAGPQGPARPAVRIREDGGHRVARLHFDGVERRLIHGTERAMRRLERPIAPEHPVIV